MKYSVQSSLRALRIAALALVAVGLAPLPADAQFRGRESSSWVSTWGASPSDPADALDGQTIREHVRLSLGGDRKSVV